MSGSQTLLERISSPTNHDMTASVKDLKKGRTISWIDVACVISMCSMHPLYVIKHQVKLYRTCVPNDSSKALGPPLAQPEVCGVLLGQLKPLLSKPQFMYIYI